jgi:AraC family transcriptional regulator of adaptative response/methylated-DNA-[protein]-cysteine methyltransferase
MENQDETPGFIGQLITELNENPFLRIKDDDLAKRGIQPSLVRRWFKKHHDITFQGYQRMLRINTAYSKISSGSTVTGAAFESGYESLSGFNEAFSSIFGESPTRSKDKLVIQINRFTTPLGPMFACATNQGICLLEFSNRKMLETEFQELIRKLNAVILPGENSHLDQLQKELGEYFDGERKEFSVPLHMIGTQFQQAVWQELLKIPYGVTRTYMQQSIALNNPKGIRAIASANGFNKIAIVIPCHRVIGSDGNLTGYAGGLERKKWLLDHEKKCSGQPVQGELDFIASANHR